MSPEGVPSLNAREAVIMLGIWLQPLEGSPSVITNPTFVLPLALTVSSIPLARLMPVSGAVPPLALRLSRNAVSVKKSAKVG